MLSLLCVTGRKRQVYLRCLLVLWRCWWSLMHGAAVVLQHFALCHELDFMTLAGSGSMVVGHCLAVGRLGAPHHRIVASNLLIHRVVAAVGLLRNAPEHFGVLFPRTLLHGTCFGGFQGHHPIDTLMTLTINPKQ